MVVVMAGSQSFFSPAFLRQVRIRLLSIAPHTYTDTTATRTFTGSFPLLKKLGPALDVCYDSVCMGTIGRDQ